MTKLKQVNDLINGNLIGNPDYEIKDINSLYKANKGEITFTKDDNIDINKINAGCLIVKKESALKYKNIIYVENPYEAFSVLLNFFRPEPEFRQGKIISIDSTAKICKEVIIGDFSFIGKNSIIGDNTKIHSNVSIYSNVKIGKNCKIYSNVVIREDVVIGDNVIIHSGAIIGSDGFGYYRDNQNTAHKIPQRGRVIIEKNCEIGANVCIDRSTVEDTIIEENVKLDNLIQVGHNVIIGKNTTISALTGISGSTKIGKDVIMAGQVGIADHIEIADGSIIAGKTGITGTIKKRGIYAGYPYQDIRSWRKSIVLFKNLENIVERIKILEKKIEKKEEK